MISQKENRINLPNLLLIAGNGRNVGKTWLACKIIKQLSQKHKITAIKISSHFHPVDKDDIIIQNERFIITSETGVNIKDSSLLLQSGAEKVFFIMAPRQHLQEAFNFLKEELKNKFVICESGGLVEHVIPGIFLFVMRKAENIRKPHLLEYSPIRIYYDGREIDFDICRILLEYGKFKLKK